MSISQRLHDLLNLGYTYTNKLFDIYLKFRSKCASCFYLLTRQLCFPALLSGASGTLHTPSPGQVYRGAVTLRAKRAGPSLGFGSSLHTGVLLLVVLARGCAQAVLVLRREVSSEHCCEGRSQQVDLGRACPAGGQAGGTGRPVAVTGRRGLGGQSDAGSRLEQSGTHWVVLSREQPHVTCPVGRSLSLLDREQVATGQGAAAGRCMLSPMQQGGPRTRGELGRRKRVSRAGSRSCTNSVPSQLTGHPGHLPALDFDDY